MYSSGQLPWTRIHEFLLNVGKVREAKAFSVQVIRQIYDLVPYDQARVYFVDANGKVHDQALIGVEPVWSDVYLGYYSQIENGRYSIPARLGNGGRSAPEFEGGVHDWTTCTPDEFITGYIKPQRLRSSAGGAFHDAENFAKSVFSLDRTGRAQYTAREIDIMRSIQPHLDNLHRNLFVRATGKRGVVRDQVEGQDLSRREAEIAGLLCRGMTPARIAGRLYLSLPTVYRHIANIHTKLGVSNRQELLLKLIGKME